MHTEETYEGSNKRIIMTLANATEKMQSLFNEVCAYNIKHYPNWDWKEFVSFSEPYISADRTNEIMNTINYMVGGDTRVYVYIDQDRVVRCVYSNDGYYNNIKRIR